MGGPRREPRRKPCSPAAAATAPCRTAAPSAHCRTRALPVSPAGVCTRYLQTDSAQTVPTLQLAVVLTVVAGAGLILFIAVPSWAHALYAALRRRRQLRCAARAAQAEEGSEKPTEGKSASVDLESQPSAAGGQPDHMFAALMLRSTSSVIAKARLSAQPSARTAAAAEKERRRALLRSYGAAAVIGTLVALQALTLVRSQPPHSCRRCVPARVARLRVG